MKLRIGTRKSKLAQIQADLVGKELTSKYGYEYEKVLIETTGDKILDVSIDKIGEKGLFVKDIEIAMIHGNVDGAVHSMKDMPYEIPEGFEIAAVPMREDVRDVFISSSHCDFFNLPKGAIVGTSSIRRSKQVKMLRPDIETVPIRGNVQTRVEKMKKEGMQGIILAAAGIKRLGMEDVIVNYFDPEVFVPAVGQGALAVETLSKGHKAELFRGLDSKYHRMCIEAERSFMRKLNGGCSVTIGAYAKMDGHMMSIIGIFEVSGRVVKKDVEGNAEDYIKLGELLAEKILYS